MLPGHHRMTLEEFAVGVVLIAGFILIIISKD